MPYPTQQLAYFGHHKCASTWIHNIVENVCDEAGWSSAYLANAGAFDGDLKAWLEHHPVQFVNYVNADWAQVAPLAGSFRGFHVVRDPRDILTSPYFSHLHSNSTEAWPELIEHRKQLQAVSPEEGLMLQLEFNSDVLNEMAAWNYDQPDVLELKMEELTPDPLNVWLRIFRHLGVIDEEHRGKSAMLGFVVRSGLNVLHHHGRWPTKRPLASLPAERLLGIVHDNRFETKTGGRKEGQESVTSHYRKGVAGDWMNHFTPDHVEAFKERYGDLVVRLGYETSNDWGLPATA